jgi:uncharacterized LabA/DUF88 family protein
MTDVQIATELLLDAYDGAVDLMLIVSADSDLVPPIRAVRTRFPAVKTVVAFPPGRNSVQLRRAAHNALSVKPEMIEKCTLPDTITKADGHTLHRPPSWR